MNDIDKAKKLLQEKYTVIQVAPSMKTVAGEAFGKPPGTYMGGKLITLLRELGFRRVFETDFGAELRVMEEAAELKNRINANSRLPMMTSCCPSWVGICVKMYPQLVHLLSTCKSPMGMVTSLTKTYFKEIEKLDDVGVVSLMPCFAKKMEAAKGQSDISLTIGEIAQWAKDEGIEFRSLPDGSWDAPFGMASSAGTIYASTGGVSEATMRTFIDLYTNEKFSDHIYTEKELLGEGIREVCIEAGRYELNVAIVEGVQSIGTFCKRLISDIEKGKSKYEMVEVMACKGGCVGGNGMPNQGDDDAIKARIRLLKQYDHRTFVKAAHENPLVQEIYSRYLEAPYSEKARKILHHKDFNDMFG